MLVFWHGDSRGDADRADGGRADRAGGLGALGQDRAASGRAGADRAARGAGWASRAIAREVGCARGVVSRWRVRFAKDRLAGLADAPRSGKPKTYGADADRRILALLDRPPPGGFARWTAPLLAKELGDVSDQYVWRFLRAQRIDLAGRKSWCLSSRPRVRRQGRRHRRPLSRSARGRDRARGRREAGASRPSSGRRAISSCPNGRIAPPATAHDVQAARHDHPVRRARRRDRPDQGQATTKRRRRVEFLDFMNEIVADHPDREIHVVLDNLKTHKPKRDRLAGRGTERPLPLHADPRLLAEPGRDLVLDPRPQRPPGASFTSVPKLRQAIDAFIERYNRTPRPSNGARPRSIPKISLNGSRIYDSEY